MKKASLITDGSCLGNPGPGGWTCILRFGAVKKEFFGYDPHTTNNVRQGITQWVIGWKRQHWWKKNHSVRNADLWIELDALAGLHKTNWTWTKGHADHEDNNRCDWLAQNAARTQTSSWPDNRAHAPLRLDLGRDYVPPKPQAGLFDALDSGEDEDDESDPG